MGSDFFRNICCSERDESLYKPKTNFTTEEEETDREQTNLLTKLSRMPDNLTNLTIKKKNLVQKINRDPYEVYSVINDIGEGAFGKAQLVSLKSNPQIKRALKIIPKENMNTTYNEAGISAEIEILRRLDHPYIVKIYEFYEDNNNFYFVNEFCPDGDLAGQLEKSGSFSEWAVRHFLAQILEAVVYLHENHVIHGDIKLENILVDNESYLNSRVRRFSSIHQKYNQHINEKKNNIDGGLRHIGSKKLKDKQKSKIIKTQSEINFDNEINNFSIKLIDFGCSKIFNNNKKLSGIIGTTVYCSPEVVNNSFDDKCDEWCCGILAYYLLYKRFPFQGINEKEIFNKILKDPVKFPSNGMFTQNVPEVSDECRDLISKLLEKDSEKRISAKEALKHPFFDQYNLVLSQIEENETDELMKRLEQLPEETNRQSKFKEMVIAYITLNFINKKEENKLHKAFKTIDVSKECHITKQDLSNFIGRNSIKKKNSNEISAIFNALDRDGNGSIEFQEFERALSNREDLLTDENLKSAFSFFDIDNSGDIDFEEIYHRIFEGKEGVANEEIMNEFLTQIGKTKEDKITFDEFKELITK